MTIKEAISRADMVRPNVLPEEQKAAWVQDVEGRFSETRGTLPPARSWPAGGTLRIPPPHDMVYVHYLCAMIDWANQETALYANDAALFNASLAEAEAWWRRHHMPRGARRWEVGL